MVMKRRLTAWCIALIVILTYLIPAGAQAAEPDELRLDIATADNRPLSLDRLVYTAFLDIGYKATHTPAASLQAGYQLANNGERDGVISSTPDMEQTYLNLIRVPVVLENNNCNVYVRADSDIEVTQWSDLSGLRVGMLSQRVYIESQTPNDASKIAKDTTKLLFSGLIRGDCDVVVLSNRAHETVNLPDGVVFSETIDVLPEYLYLHKRHADLAPAVAEALEAMFEDGRGDKILDNMPVPEMYSKKTVLHLISANVEITREDQFSRTLREYFQDDTSIEWYSMALNSKRYAGDSQRLNYFANLLRQDCVSRNIAAIVVSGEEAFDFLKEYYYLFFKNTPVLFYGLGDDYEAEIQGYEQYSSGVVEGLSAYETVSAALELFPGTTNVFVVNDYLAEGINYRAAIEKQLSPLAADINIEYNEDLSRDELIEQISDLPDSGIVFVGSYFCDANLQYFPLNEMKRILESSCDVPIFALYSTDLPYDAVGGKCLDYEKYGEVLAGQLQRLLDGAPVGDIPIIADSEEYNQWVFDKLVMDRWGISESDIPAGSLVINATASIWESNPRFAYTLIFLFVFVTVTLVGITIFLNKYRRQTENLLTAEELLAKDAKLKEVKERLERIINTAPLAYGLNIDNVLCEVNEYMAERLGMTIGCDVREYYVGLEERDRAYERLARNALSASQIIRFKLANGEVHRFFGNYAFVEYEGKRATVLWAMDIENNELKTDQLNAARESLQTILDLLPVPVRITDKTDVMPGSRVVYANKACGELWGYDRQEDVIGQPIKKFLPEVQPSGDDAPEQLPEKIPGQDAFSVTYQTASGKLVETSLVTRAINYLGKQCSLGIIKDITAENEFKRMMTEAADKEREANKLKSVFLSNMSHEIRTPMNAIIGLTEVELRKDVPVQVKEIYRKINISAKNLLQIINDILDLSKIEADKMELYIDEFELEQALNDALMVVTPRLEAKNVELLLKADTHLPRFVRGDKTRLWQILKNFLDNAAKYTDKGRIVLSVSADSKLTDEERVGLAFTITDTGIGMTDEQIEKVCLPYEQVYGDAQKRYTGTGLGMPISKRFVEMMGGSMEISSTIGTGTVIRFSIPFLRAENESLRTHADDEGSQLAGLKVLAVDDEELSLEIMRELLESYGARCTLAGSGEEALRIISESRTNGIFYDVIMLDYIMPGLNGLETARRIHMSLSKSPKLLMVTAYQKMLLINDLKQNGIDGILEKPFIPSQLLRKMQAVLGLSSADEYERHETYTRFHHARILLCEDNLINQEVAAGMLGEFGVTVVAADNGKIGLELLKSDGPFDLVLMDLHMPVMDGYEATRAIRANPKFDTLPVISLTADAMSEVSLKCLEAGMNDSITKPVEFDSLHSILLKWLGASKPESDQHGA